MGVFGGYLWKCVQYIFGQIALWFQMWVPYVLLNGWEIQMGFATVLFFFQCHSLAWSQDRIGEDRIHAGMGSMCRDNDVKEKSPQRLQSHKRIYVLLIYFILLLFLSFGRVVPNIFQSVFLDPLVLPCIVLQLLRPLYSGKALDPAVCLICCGFVFVPPKRFRETWFKDVYWKCMKVLMIFLQENWPKILRKERL